MKLENVIHACVPFGRKSEMAIKRIKREVLINGKKVWITAKNEQEYVNRIMELSADKKPFTNTVISLKDYAYEWFNVYCKPNVETSTQLTYKRQIDKYIIPSFGEKNISDISVSDVQKLFNSMQVSIASKFKVKQVLNMIFNMAIDDGLIERNPLQSSRIRITGASSEFRKEYTLEQMREIIKNVRMVKNMTDRRFLLLLSLHPLRLEEVLGLKWSDIDRENMILHVRRAVTHPTRNLPEIKTPKTVSSIRSMSLSRKAEKELGDGNPDDFIIGGPSPYSYTKVKRMCERIQKDIGFEEKITPSRFRTTVLTDIYDVTKDIKQTQLAAGHTTAAMTLKHYIKGRKENTKTSDIIDSVYGQCS